MPFRWLHRQPTPVTSVPTVSLGDATGPVAAIGSSAPRPTAFPARLPSLASATRDYAHAIDMGTVDRIGARDLARLSAAMGPDLWSWQRARRLTYQAPWRASPNQAEHYERARGVRQMMDDIATWERAMAEVDAETRRAALYGRPAPPPLDVPVAVMRLIEARRTAALEKATRRRHRADEGDGGLLPRPEEAVLHPPAPAKPV